MDRQKSQRKSVAEQAETLNKPIRMDGVGEDPAIQALVSEDFLKMSNQDALAVATAVAKLVYGSIEKDLTKLTERMAKMDEDQRRWMEDRDRWLAEMDKRMESTLRSSSGQKAAAKGADLMKQAMEEVKAEAINRRLMIDAKVANAKKVLVSSQGIPVKVRVGDSVETRYDPEVIRYEHLTYVLKRGVPVEVPDFIYEDWVKRQAQVKEKDDKLQEALKKMGDFRDVVRAAPEVDPEYASTVQQQISNKGIELP